MGFVGCIYLSVFMYLFLVLWVFFFFFKNNSGLLVLFAWVFFKEKKVEEWS